nr:unnamed protein product [Callosobruchus analis]
MDDEKSFGGEYIILGDLNVKSPQWGSPTADKRGLYLSDWIAESELVVPNTGDKPTFSRWLIQSYIDVTISTPNLAKDIAKWEVLDEESLSDHHFIYSEVGKKKKLSQNSWEIRPEINWEEFRILTEWKAKIHHDCDSETFTAIIKESYKDSHPKTQTRIGQKMPYWWCEDIHNKRKDCLRARRILKRTSCRRETSDVLIFEARESYKRAKKILQSAIVKSKEAHWKTVCSELDQDIWGQGYRIAMKKLNIFRPYELDIDRKKEIARELFPVAPYTLSDFVKEDNIHSIHASGAGRRNREDETRESTRA